MRKPTPRPCRWTCGLSFALPWGYMGLAVALVAVALLLSVAYGLHRCKASNVVEALRDIA